MTGGRNLGACWAAAHGPQDPRGLLLWTLKLGFSGLCVGPAPRNVDWVAVRTQRASLPITFPALRVASILEVDQRPDLGLCSSSHAEQELALRRIRETVALARQLGVRQVILEPGAVKPTGESGPLDLGDSTQRWTKDLAQTQLARRNAVLDRALDQACRAIHRLLKEHPDVVFCLTGSRHAFGLGDPRCLTLVFEDQRSANLRYWHDAAVAARRSELLGVDQGAWLEAFSDRLAGITLGDSADGVLYLPPGAGSVDHSLIATYRQRLGKPTPLVVELDPRVDTGEMPGLHAFLAKWGL